MLSFGRKNITFCLESYRIYRFSFGKKEVYSIGSLFDGLFMQHNVSRCFPYRAVGQSIERTALSVGTLWFIRLSFRNKKTCWYFSSLDFSFRQI